MTANVFAITLSTASQCCFDPDMVQKQAELHKERQKKFKNIPDPVYSITLEGLKK